MSKQENISEEDIIILNDEEGNEYKFVIMDMVEVEKDTYAILLPVGENQTIDEDDLCEILKLVKEDGEEALVHIEDEEEYNRVVEAIEQIFEEEEEEF